MEADKQMIKKMIEKYCVNCRGYFFGVSRVVKKLFEATSIVVGRV